MSAYEGKPIQLDGISVKYIYSACIITKTSDVTILHDPWFTEAIYDGSWFQFPKIINPIDSIGDVDFIYVSHIHPDHYDSKFLKEYFNKFGVKKILIANHLPNHLFGKMRSDGFTPFILSDILTIGKTSVEIIPHKTGSSSDIDSAIIIKYHDDIKNHCVVNVNDIIFDDEMLKLLKNKSNDIDILLCSYTGAGPYPQTYFSFNDEQLKIEAENKKLSFFNRYKKLTSVLKAKRNIPFAGKYILGGKLSHLNFVRGVADPVEVLEFDKNAIILADNGGEIGTLTLKANKTRTKKYETKEIENAISALIHKQMDYERLISLEEIEQLPIKRLLYSACRNAVSKSELEDDYFFCIKIQSEEYAVINANKNARDFIKYIAEYNNLPTPRSEIEIDMRYLFGLITNIYHWNNAEVGSQFNTKRIPNKYNKKAQTFLNFLAI
jgi:UDP-MurNAc hydroxylase